MLFYFIASVSDYPTLRPFVLVSISNSDFSCSLILFFFCKDKIDKIMEKLVNSNKKKQLIVFLLENLRSSFYLHLRNEYSELCEFF